MRVSLLSGLLYLCTNIMILTSMPAAAAESADQVLYMKHLEYEYNNRTVAYLSMKSAAKVLEGKPAGDFYQAYFDMEVMSRTIYKRSAVLLNFDCQPNWVTRVRGHAGAFAARFITFSPQSLINIIEPYIPKLEQLRDLADAQHRGFFDYVLAQEQAQLVASQIAKAEGWEQGAKVLRAFVDGIDIDKVMGVHGERMGENLGE